MGMGIVTQEWEAQICSVSARLSC